jgi:hypothetical protein
MPDSSYPLTELIETLQGDWTGREGAAGRQLEINRSYLCRFLRFTLIAPDSAEAVLECR